MMENLQSLVYLLPPPDAIRALLARHRYALLLDGLGSGPFAAHTCRLHSNPRICEETVAMYIYEAQRLGRPYRAEVLAWDGRQWLVMEQELSTEEVVHAIPQSVLRH